MYFTIPSSPRTAGSAVLMPGNRWDFTFPPLAETSPSGASSSGMWQSWQERAFGGR